LSILIYCDMIVSYMPKNILISLLLSSGLSASGFFATGEPCAKNKILIAIARPACNATTATSRTFEVLTSVAERTGHL